MANITRENLQCFCRTCLSTLDQQPPALENIAKKHNIYHTKDLLEWFKTCTALKANENDEQPQWICRQCYNKLQQYYEFRSMCIRSAHVFLGVVGISTISASKKDDVEIDTYSNIKEEEDEEEDDDEEKDAIDDERTQMIVPDFVRDKKISTEIDKTEPESDIEILEDDNEQSTNALEFAEAILAERTEPIAGANKFAKNIGHSYTDDVPQNLNIDNNSTDSESSIDLYDLDTKKKERLMSLIKPPAITDPLEQPQSAPPRQCNFAPLTPPTKHSGFKFHCDKCTLRFGTQENLETHKRAQHDPKPFQCPQCDRGFNSAYRLRLHVREAHSDEAFICSYEGCNKVYTHKASYHRHYRIIHKGIKPPKQKKNYACSECGRTFKDKTSLREHSYRHSSEENYPYQCEECGRRYTHQHTYRVHLMRHAGIKNFECPHCGKKMTTRGELQIHINFHTKERTYPCQLCPKVLSSATNLSLHNRAVHKGIKRYTCSYCDESFSRKLVLKHHEMRHTGEKPHVCSICQKGFIQPGSLKAHEKTHEKKELKKAAKKAARAAAQCK